MIRFISETLRSEWHPQRNAGLSAEDLSAGSHKKVWWQCPEGHEWLAAVYSRSAGATCPYCAGNRVITGVNDLASLDPQLAAQWHPDRNKELRSEQVKASSNQKVWWICPRGHEWRCAVSDRAAGTGCPYCAGQKVWPGFNDLAAVRPELAAEWHPQRNKELTPFLVTAGSSRKVWWRCSQGHEWQAVIAQRQKANCPYCSNKKILKGYNDLATVKPELAAEWHPVKNAGLTPETIGGGSPKRAWWLCKEGHEWQAVIASRSKGYGCPYCCGRKAVPGLNDLATLNKQLAAEWHPFRNKDLLPSAIKLYSNQKIWWQCAEGHEWRSTAGNRAMGRGCPYCAGRRVLPGYNDLAALNPALAAQWHPLKNDGLLPCEVTSSASRKVWWQCEANHEWRATVNSRAGGRNCPYCNKESGTSFAEQAIFYYCRRFFDVRSRYQLAGYEIDVYIPQRKIGIEHDGLFFHSSLAAMKREKRKNEALRQLGICLIRIKEGKSFSINAGEKIIYYQYSQNHYDELEQAIRLLLEMIFQQTGESCAVDIDVQRDYTLILKQYLGKIKAQSLVNSPQLMKLWNPERNQGLSPSYFTQGSNKKVWWRCEKGHKWQALISSVTAGNRCPYCANRRVLAGFNDLATTAPQLAREWHPFLNGELKTAEVTAGANRRVWWQCEKGHEWQAVIAQRKKGGCPYCAGRKTAAPTSP